MAKILRWGIIINCRICLLHNIFPILWYLAHFDKDIWIWAPLVEGDKRNMEYHRFDGDNNLFLDLWIRCCLTSFIFRSSAWCLGLACSVWLWYFLFILTYFLGRWPYEDSFCAIAFNLGQQFMRRCHFYIFGGNLSRGPQKEHLCEIIVNLGQCLGYKEKKKVYPCQTMTYNKRWAKRHRFHIHICGV